MAVVTKTFIVSVDGDATQAQRDAFTTHLRTEYPTCGFWHHASYTWLLAIDSPPPTLTVTALRDKLLELMPGVSTVVLDVKPMTYAAYSPESGHKWLADNMSKP
jgi:hypothetical protein